MTRIAMFVTAAVLLLCSTAYAQDPLENYAPGHWMFNTTTGFSYSNYSGDLYEVGNDAVSVVQFDVVAGVLVSRNVIIGGQVAYGSRTVNDRSTSTVGIGPQIVYAFLGSSRWVPSIGAALLYQQISGPSDATVLSVVLKGGLGYMLTPNISFGGAIQLQMDNASFNGGNTTESGMLLSLGLGFGILL